jgi:hypothetical protein
MTFVIPENMTNEEIDLFKKKKSFLKCKKIKLDTDYISISPKKNTIMYIHDFNSNYYYCLIYKVKENDCYYDCYCTSL